MTFCDRIRNIADRIRSAVRPPLISVNQCKSVVKSLLWLANPAVSTAILLALMVWAFARAYYFAFYVIGKYVDPQYRFSGLLSFLRYLLRRRKSKGRELPGNPS